MKKLLAVGLALVLSGCGGGFDDMDAARPGGGIGSTVTKPTIPSEKSNWQYSSVSNGAGVFSLSAMNYSTNTYQRPVYQNLRGKAFVKLERDLGSDGAITDTVTIFTDSNMSCLPSCNVRMSFDGNWATYQMRHSSDGVIKPINDSVEKTLFKKFTTSNRATVDLPIIGLSEPFGANFDLSGYDMKLMKFISE